MLNKERVLSEVHNDSIDSCNRYRVIPSSWVRAGCDGEIDNSKFLLDGKLKPYLILHTDYEVVTKETWDHIKQYVKGGPEIEIKNKKLSVLEDFYEFTVLYNDNKFNIIVTGDHTFRDISIMMERFTYTETDIFSEYMGVTEQILDLDTPLSELGFPKRYTISIAPHLNRSTPCTLINTGNTCYMNSVLQCLWCCIPIRQRIMNYGIDPSASENKALCYELSNVMRAMNESKTSISTEALKSRFGAIHPNFASFEQQDPHEFLIGLIDGVSEVDNSIINDFFSTRCRDTVRCHTCGATTGNEQPAVVLTLDLPQYRNSVFIIPSDISRSVTQMVNPIRVLGNPKYLMAYYDGEIKEGFNPDAVLTYALEKDDENEEYMLGSVVSDKGCIAPFIARKNEPEDETKRRVARLFLIDESHVVAVVIESDHFYAYLDIPDDKARENLRESIGAVEDPSIPLKDLINFSLAEKPIEDRVFCESCKGNTTKSIKTSIVSLGKYVILNISRANNNQKKNEAKINFPQVMDFGQFLSTGERQDYILRGACIHTSWDSICLGHYYAVCREYDNNWYEISDDLVKRVAEIDTTQAYLVFYERV